MEFLKMCRQGIVLLFGVENQNLLNAFILLVVLDYITGVCVAVHSRTLSSEIGAKGISRKIMIFILISLSNVADTYFLQSGTMLEAITILFYCSNEFISILENADKLNIPAPKKLKEVCKKISKEDED